MVLNLDGYRHLQTGSTWSGLKSNYPSGAESKTGHLDQPETVANPALILTLTKQTKQTQSINRKKTTTKQIYFLYGGSYSAQHWQDNVGVPYQLGGKAC